MIVKHKPGPLAKSDRKDIAAFQREEGLLDDGKLGRQSWRYLLALVAHLRARLDRLASDYEALMLDCAAEDRRSDMAEGSFLAGLAAGAALGVILAALFLAV